MQIFNSMAQLHMSGQANARWVMQALLEVANPFLPPSATDLPLGRLAQELPRAGLSFLDHEWGSGGSQRELGLQEAVRVACENQLRLGQTPERPRALRSRPAAVTAPVNEIFARRELDELRASTAARRRCGLPRETSGEYDPLPEPGDTADASVVVAWAERACWDAAAGYTSVVSEWPRVRARLLRDGLVGPPTPEYLVLMVRGLAPLWDGLALDPALLTDEIWRLFQPEEAVLIALNGVEQYPPEGHWWSLNLASLATRGLIEASRLRDSCERAIDGCRWPGKTRFYKRTLKFLATGRTELFLSR
jgi:hypothetical protein